MHLLHAHLVLPLIACTDTLQANQTKIDYK